MNDKLLVTAIQAALHAGEILRKGFGNQCEISYKPGVYNLVTQYDHAAEKAIIDMIRLEFPHHSFIAEESGVSHFENAPVVWVIDPLDGTTNFAHGIPLFAVSIAAMVNQQVQVGVIYVPMTHELFVSIKDQGAYLNGIRLKVSQTADFSRALGSTGFPHDIGENSSLYIKRLSKIASTGKPIRDIGSAAVNLAYLASGRFDYYWIDSLQPWDMAAGKLLVEEAGGRVTHYDGGPINLSEEGSLLASNNLLQKIILEFFR